MSDERGLEESLVRLTIGKARTKASELVHRLDNAIMLLGQIDPISPRHHAECEAIRRELRRALAGVLKIRGDFDYELRQARIADDCGETLHAQAEGIEKQTD